jgi:hypothetical protein
MKEGEMGGTYSANEIEEKFVVFWKENQNG